MVRVPTMRRTYIGRVPQESVLLTLGHTLRPAPSPRRKEEADSLEKTVDSGSKTVPVDRPAVTDQSGRFSSSSGLSAAALRS